MIFPCDQCGLCCKHLECVPELKKFDSGNGKCVHLMDNNLCEIYHTRPDICNVSKMYQLHYKELMSEAEYIKNNIEGCKALKIKYIK